MNISIWIICTVLAAIALTADAQTPGELSTPAAFPTFPTEPATEPTTEPAESEESAESNESEESTGSEESEESDESGEGHRRRPNRNSFRGNGRKRGIFRRL